MANKIPFSEIAASAYRAYAANTGNKNYRGDPMPAFHELPVAIQTAWEAASCQVACCLEFNRPHDESRWKGWARPEGSGAPVSLIRSQPRPSNGIDGPTPAILESSLVSEKPFKPTGVPLTIYTDGSCLKNPGGAIGWACLMLGPDRKPLGSLSGGSPTGTNNIAELMAAITALESLPEGATATVISDSKYVVDGITSWIINWRKKKFDEVKNADLWRRLDALAQKRNVKFEWVKGHSTNPYNQFVDKMAGKAARNFMKVTESGNLQRSLRKVS